MKHVDSRQLSEGAERIRREGGEPRQILGEGVLVSAELDACARILRGRAYRIARDGDELVDVDA